MKQLLITLILPSLLLFFFFTNKVEAQQFPSTNQNKTIARVRSLVSSFFSFSQFQAVFDVVSNDIYNQCNMTQIKNDAMTAIMAQLTSSQYSTLMSKMTMLILANGPSAITSMQTTMIPVLSNNLFPFFSQLQGYVVYLKNRGLQKKGVVKNGYRIVNSFTSKKRVKTIITRLSIKYTSSQWNSIVSNLNGIIQFTKNGF